MIRKPFPLFEASGYTGLEEDKVGEEGQSQILEGLEMQVKKFGLYYVDDDSQSTFFCRRIA